MRDYRERFSWVIIVVDYYDKFACNFVCERYFAGETVRVVMDHFVFPGSNNHEYNNLGVIIQ